MRSLDRRSVLEGFAGLVIAGLAAPASARGLGLGSILGRASDSALDRLAQPGAFYNDEDIRIGLPLVGNVGGGALSALARANRRLNLLDGLTRKINHAAGVAAREAKPIFRAAIDELSLADVPGIARQSDGATQYLYQSAGDELHAKLYPLVDDALGHTGVYRELGRLNDRHSFLGLAGLDRDGLSNSVTSQALDGIFRYIGSEEAKLRANPLGKAGGFLRGVLGD
jgi:hypothetical protein